MNIIEATGIVDTFSQFNFNVDYESLWTLADHYSSAKSRLLVLTSFSSMDDFYLGFLLFGQTDMPTYIVTDFPNPFASSCFANNVHILPCNPELKNHTTRLIEHFRKNNNFVLVIAMHDARKERTHSGYLYLAQALQVPMIVAGFNHFDRSFLVSTKRIPPPKPQDDIAAFRLEHEIQMLDQLRPRQGLTVLSANKYMKDRPEFEVTAMRQAMVTRIAGNRVTGSEIIVIVCITAVIVVLIIVCYFMSESKKNKKKDI